jgi:hypothetical protein
MVLSGDGVAGALLFDLMLDAKDISEAPKDDFHCVDMTQQYCLKPSNYADVLKSHASIMPVSPF